jgi:5-formyltetrahydrofolate cyclo-ligase
MDHPRGTSRTQSAEEDAPGAKQAVRERVWRAMTEGGAARFPGAAGRIPNFVGAEAAARELAEQPEWRDARVVKANPDAPQLPVRAAALAAGKLVYVAVPRLRSERPFLALDPGRLDVAPRRAASIRGAAVHGIPTGLEELVHVDLVVCGSVAVGAGGCRVGKGGGYSDLEYALAAEVGAVDDRTTIATTVHPLQVLDEDLPETAHDFRVDLAVTPDHVRRWPRAARPAGVRWDHLDDATVAAVPALAARRPGSG